MARQEIALGEFRNALNFESRSIFSHSLFARSMNLPDAKKNERGYPRMRHEKSKFETFNKKNVDVELFLWTLSLISPFFDRSRQVTKLVRAHLFTLQVEPTDRIEEVKAMIQDKEGVP